MFWVPNICPAPFLLMLQEDVELNPVALCHRFTRKRILNRKCVGFYFKKIKVVISSTAYTSVVNMRTFWMALAKTNTPTQSSGCLPGEGDRDSDSRAEAHQSPAALAEGLQAGE